MIRLVIGTVSLLVVGCVVAAMVEAQDSSRRNVNPSLIGQYQNAGRSIAAEYASPSNDGQLTSSNDVMLVADTGSSGGLQSVLKRRIVRNSAEQESQPSEPATLNAPEPKQTTTAVEPATISEPAPLKTAFRETGSSRRVTTPATSPASPITTQPPARLDSTSAPASRRDPALPLTNNSPLSITANSVPARRVIPGPGGSGAGGDSTLAVSIGPLLVVETVGPTAIIIGEEAAFKVRVANRGDQVAANVSLAIAIPDNVQVAGAMDQQGVVSSELNPAGQLAWSLDKVAAGALHELTLRVVPQSDGAFDLPVAWQMAPISAIARVQVQQPLIEIAIDGGSEITYGETHVYRIVVSNPGTGDAGNVFVNVSLGPEAAGTLEVGTLPAGQRKTFDVEVTAREAGTMRIQAEVTADHDLEAQAIAEVLVRRAELDVETTGPGLQFSGLTGTYQVRVRNTGNAVARGTTAAVRLPEGVKYLEGLAGVSQEGETIKWQVGDVEPGGEKTFQFECSLVGDGPATLQFALSEASGLQATSVVRTIIEAIADLKLTVNDPKGPIPVGQDVTYEIHITNRGSEAASQVHVVGQFSAGIEPIGVDGMPGKLAPGQVVFEPIARINPKETVKMLVKARADQGGNHVFRASVQCSDPDTRLVAEDTTRYYGGEQLGGEAPTTAASPSDTDHTVPPSVGTRSFWSPQDVRE